MSSRIYRISAALLAVAFVNGCAGSGGAGGVIAPSQMQRDAVAPESIAPLKFEPRGQTKIGGAWKHPYSVAVDENTHDVYVSDDTGVTKIAPGGTMSKVGNGILAPRGLAVNSKTHDVYVVDGHELKSIYPDGRTATVAFGFVNPIAACAETTTQHVEIADPGSHELWLLSPEGKKVVVASNVDATALACVPNSGWVYAAEPDLNAVYKINILENIPIGSGWRGPVGVALDNKTGHLYVSTLGDSAVWDMAPDGSRTRVGDGFKGPFSLAVDSGADRLYVVDQVAQTVYRITNAVSENIKFQAHPLFAPAISGLAFDSEHHDLYVLTHIKGNGTTSSAIMIVAKDGSAKVWYDVGDYNVLPGLLAVDDKADYVYFLSESGGGLYRIRESDLETTQLAEKLNAATSMAVDPNTHDLYVGIGDHVSKIAPDGTTTKFEKGVYPAGLSVDPTTHDLYVSDFLFVRRYNPDGTVARKYNYLQFPTTLAFDPTTKTFYYQGLDKLKRVTPDDRIETVGEGFEDIRGLTIDPLTGSVYVADWNKTNNIWKFVP